MMLVEVASRLLDGTPAYSYANVGYRQVVELYLRTEPTYRLGYDTVSREGDTVAAEFLPSTFLEWGNLRHRIREEDRVVRHLLSNLRQDDVFFDIGANIGVYACLAGQLLPDENVVAFEPYPPNAARLRANLAANDITAEVRTCALANKEGTATFYVYKHRQAGAQHPSLDTEYPTDEIVDTVAVETKRGETLVDDGLPAPTVVKVDVQGTGIDVLDGLAEPITASQCRLVYVEPHGNETQLRTWLSEAGFDVDTIEITRQGKEPFLVGYDPDTVDGPPSAYSLAN